MQLQAENVQECVKDFDKAIELDPDNSDIYHHRGQVSAISTFSENTYLSVMKFTNNEFGVWTHKGPSQVSTLQRCLYFSQTSLIWIPRGQSQVSALQRCLY